MKITMMGIKVHRKVVLRAGRDEQGPLSAPCSSEQEVHRQQGRKERGIKHRGVVHCRERSLMTPWHEEATQIEQDCI